GATLRIVGVDVAATLLRANAGRFDAALGADVLRLPVRDDSADVVCCSQLLHHFAGADARSLVGELQRAARPGGSVVLSDLRRSHVAAAGFLLASWAMHFDSITRHDGVVSVYRGFTADELRDLISGVTGVTPEVRKRAFWRVTAVWTKPCR